MPPYDASIAEKLTPFAQYIGKSVKYAGQKGWSYSKQGTQWLIQKIRTNPTKSTGAVGPTPQSYDPYVSSKTPETPSPVIPAASRQLSDSPSEKPV
jgi:hypothetical protein